MRNFIILLLSLLTLTGYAQKDEIMAVGKVTHAFSGKGIKARILYKSMPTGGITGRFNDSTFSFAIFGTAKYQITAEAEGFIPATVIVDPKDVNAERKVIRDIKLTPAGETIRLNTLTFEQSKAAISAKSFGELDELLAMMKENTNMVIQLEGHTDIAGDAGKNMELSQDRVDAVKKYLVSKGIAKDRIKTKAFGGTKPLSQVRTPEAQTLNRRVEMRVLKY